MTGRMPGDDLLVVLVFSTHAGSAFMFIHIEYVVAEQASFSIWTIYQVSYRIRCVTEPLLHGCVVVCTQALLCATISDAGLQSCCAVYTLFEESSTNRELE